MALVIGGSSGIGRAAALVFARAGYDVAIAASRPGPVEDACAEIEALGVDALGLTVDVTDAGSCEEMVSQIASRFGRLDAAFNNVGITEMSVIKNGGPPATHELPLAASLFRASSADVFSAICLSKACLVALWMTSVKWSRCSRAPVRF